MSAIALKDNRVVDFEMIRGNVMRIVEIEYAVKGKLRKK